jgi:cytochrome c-type biogenesis protein CcmI
MILWFALALMTAVAIAAVLWPLRWGGAGRGGSDVEVYRDQLEEITRDRSNGLIGVAEAEAAKVEVSRRLIAAADAVEATKVEANSAPVGRRRWIAIAAQHRFGPRPDRSHPQNGGAAKPNRLRPRNDFGRMGVGASRGSPVRSPIRISTSRNAPSSFAAICGKRGWQTAAAGGRYRPRVSTLRQIPSPCLITNGAV